MKFRGTSVSLNVCKTSISGKANVYVDNVLKTTIDLYASTSACNATGYTVSGPTGAGSDFTDTCAATCATAGVNWAGTATGRAVSQASRATAAR